MLAATGPDLFSRFDVFFNTRRADMSNKIYIYFQGSTGGRGIVCGQLDLSKVPLTS